jgi:hypothetical protein
MNTNDRHMLKLRMLIFCQRNIIAEYERHGLGSYEACENHRNMVTIFNDCVTSGKELLDYLRNAPSNNDNYTRYQLSAIIRTC